MAKLVSKTYGEALFAVALEENCIDVFYEAAKTVRQILRTNEEFQRLMNHPEIIKEEKKDIVEKTFGNALPQEMVGLMVLMITKGRAGEILSALEHFVALVKEEKRIGEAFVTTAIQLTERQKEKVEKKLLETTKYETFEMNYLVDEGLIGGMVIRIGDRVVDSSIRAKLNELSRELRNIQV